MPNYKVVDADKLDADLKYVADKIRAKGGTTEELDFPLGYGDVVDAIQTGGTSEDLNEILTEQESLIAELKSTLEGKSAGGSGSSLKLQEKTVTPAELQQVVNADTGYDGLSKVTVEPIPTEYIKPTGTKEITTNGTFSIKSYAEANVNVQPNLQEKTATENGEVTPDTGYDGLSKVVVNVTASGGSNELAQSIVDRSVTEITAEDLQGVTDIGIYAFAFCTGLTSVTIPDTIKTIGNYAFQYCKGLTSVTIPDTITSLGMVTFQNCTGLTSVTLGSGITELPQTTFGNCTGLTSVTIPDTIKTIGNYAFQYCTGLTSVTIGNGVTSIGAYAFNGCTSMEYYDFTSHTSVPTLVNVNAFQNIPSTCEIRVPLSLVDEWKSATNWSTYADQIIGV